jgi:DnaJ-domain-containing protein 1
MTWRERQEKIEQLLDNCLNAFSEDEIDQSATTLRERGITIAALAEAARDARFESDHRSEADDFYDLRRQIMSLVSQLPDTLVGQEGRSVYSVKVLREKIEELQQVDL